MILAAGPASAVRIMPFLTFLKYRVVTGTGLAQPNPVKIIRMEPNTSRCGRGLRVSRPRFLAVGSPSLSLAQAWAHSWMGMAVTNTMARTR